jgi:hypothetical protein
MLWGRPGSHIAAMFYFGILAFAFLVASFKLESARGAILVGQLIWLIPHVVGFFALATKRKWSYIYCSVVIGIVATLFAGALLVISFKAKNASIPSLIPLFIVDVALFVLFYRFTFGSASRQFYRAGTLST